MDASVSNNPSAEIWQVDVGGQIYQTNFEELTQWIAEGSLLPQDKVRRGNLRWIEAQKVPLLHGFFNARELGVAPPPVVVTTTVSTPPKTEANNFQAQNNGQTQTFSNYTQPDVSFTEIASTRFCLVHIETTPKFICENCTNVFCEECPQSYGGSVKICPMCGGMCNPIVEVVEKEQKAVAIQIAVQEGFGFKDFGRALVYPLKFRVSFFFGALFYVFFSIGQHASSLGGRWLISASIMCWMLTNMLTFGILANTVENVLQGKIGQNFMPGFDDFTLWDDVVHPLFLSLSSYLVSFGAFGALCMVMAYFLVGSVTSEIDALKNKNVVPYVAPELQENYGSAKQGKEQIDLVKETMRQNNEFMQQQREFAEGQANGETDKLVNGEPQITPPVFNEEQQFEQMNEMINKTRQQQLESTVGEQSESSGFISGSLYKTISTWGGPFILLAGVAIIWGIFYFPVALIVASYTRNLSSVMNPLVGLDTIKRLGFDYAKILLFGFLLLMIGGAINLVLNIIFAPFNLPRLGNLAAVGVGSIFTFYLSIVFSTLIGYALYKNLDSFKLYGNQ